MTWSGQLGCGVSEWATGIVTVLAAVVLVIRELRRQPSAGIPPATYAGSPAATPTVDGVTSDTDTEVHG